MSEDRVDYGLAIPIHMTDEEQKIKDLEEMIELQKKRLYELELLTGVLVMKLGERVTVRLEDMIRMKGYLLCSTSPIDKMSVEYWVVK